MVYHSSGEGRYTAQPGLSRAVEAAWVLANAAAAPLAGQARLYLLSAQAVPTKRTTIPSFLAIASMAALFTSMTTDGLRCLR